MTEPYNAVGLVPTVWGISKRADIFRNIEHHRHIIKAACWLSDIDLPVKLIILPEGALQGFNDEVLDLDHAEFANTCAIDIPGPETQALGEIAREWGVYIMGQAKARHVDFPDRFFNMGFIIDDRGEVILEQTLDSTALFGVRLSPGRVYAAAVSGHLWAIDPLDGSILWETSLEAPLSGPPVVHEDWLAVARLDGRLDLLDAATGAPVESLNYSSIIPFAPVWAFGRLYVVDSNRRVHALGAQP